MSIKLSDNIRVRQQKPLEDKYFNELVPYTSIFQVNNLLPQAVRHIGLTVNINKEEYWYKDGIENENLVLKITSSSTYDLKNQEQDDRLENIEGENAAQYDIINDLSSELQSEKTRNDIQDSMLNNLEGIYYTWSPTNRTLTLYDRGGNQLSQVSLVSLDNEGTDLRYNASTLSLDLYNGDSELLDSIPVSSFVGSVGKQLQLSSNQLQLKDNQGNILSTVGFTVSNISGLQTALDGKLDKGGYVGTAQDLKNSIDNLQIGGRNLILNSKGEIAVFHFPVTTSEPLIEGCEYTLSADVFGTLLGHVFINNSITSPIRESNFNSTTNYRRVSVTFTFVKNDYLGCEIYPHFYSGDKVKNIKLEKGNIATDWEPNPEDKQDRLQNISGSIGIGKSDASATEKLDVNGNVKANGFKTPNGTATQALRADGGVFDLTTKANLEGGKVPKAQSQPSTMVMDSSTYVITFTDATGAIQTIDLPLESLFQDANYNSDTKTLIVTLKDGTTKSIPLSDLVDLPEIVLSTSNPAVTPTSGQKVYFNTALGKVWFNVSGVWVFGGNLISDSEKTNLTTAYNHSQTTGNAHGTKVEELSDVSGTDTTIVDTDVILKKDTGGFWRKITFANFKSWFTTALTKKINIGLDTVFNFKNISAMALTEFRNITPNIETIYFTEEQNSTGWQQVRYNSNLSIGYQALTESVITINGEDFLELDSDSSFNLIDVENTKIKGIFENDFMIITFSSKVDTPSTTNQWFKLILRVNNVQVAVSPVFYLLEPAGMPERISHSFALNVTPEIITHGITLHIKPSVTLILNSHSLTVTRVHKSTNANF